MQLLALTDCPEIFIGYDQENQWLYVDWKGEHDQESSQAACLHMLECLRAWPCHKILNDYSGITCTSMQLTAWGAWWLKEMRAAGLQFMAWVLPHNLLSRHVTETVVHDIQEPRVGTFDDVASAYVWLQQQPVCTPRHANSER
jgi:hypothetical protein